jgi:hypothetical protein
VNWLTTPNRHLLIENQLEESCDAVTAETVFILPIPDLDPRVLSIYPKKKELVISLVDRSITGTRLHHSAYELLKLWSCHKPDSEDGLFLKSLSSSSTILLASSS